MPTSPATRAARAAEREAATVAAIRDRLPDLPSGTTTFVEFWRAFENVPGLAGRNEFYRILASLDGLHLPDDGLIVRIGDRDTASRRVVLVRLLRSWDEQRAHLRRYSALGRAHPPQPVTYAAAHRRVRDERGPASAHMCQDCEDRAAEWSYPGFSPDEQIGVVSGMDGDSIRAWSPVPSDYEPRCRPCHWRYDEAGLVWGVGPAPRRVSYLPPLPASALPQDAPEWVADLVERAEWRRMLRA